MLEHIFMALYMSVFKSNCFSIIITLGTEIMHANILNFKVTFNYNYYQMLNNDGSQSTVQAGNLGSIRSLATRGVFKNKS